MPFFLYQAGQNRPNFVNKFRALIPTLAGALISVGLLSCSSKKAAETQIEVNPVSTVTEPQASPAPTASANEAEENEKLMKQKIVSYKLANGLQLYLIEKKAIPMATVLIAVKNGSFAENETNNGLAHLYEHMFFKANEKIPAQADFMRNLDEMGIELGANMNAYTSTESVRYFFTIQTGYLSRGLSFMADALMTPKFLQEELEKERKVVIGEFDRFEASPTDVFFQRSLMKKLFPQNFIRKNVIGTRPVILSATQDQMHEIQHRYYIPNNSALFIVGDFDETQIRADIEKNFGNWKPGSDPFKSYPVPEEPALPKTLSFVESAPVQQVNILEAFHGPSLTKDNKGIMAFDLISQMTHMESSPFQKELVHSGIASSAAFIAWSQRYTSPLVFTVEATPQNAQKAYQILQTLITRMKKGGFFTEQALQVAKNSNEISSAYDRESAQRYALNLANVWTSTGALDFYLDYIDQMKAVTLADIDHYLQTYLGNSYVIGGLTPTGSKSLEFTEPLAP